MAFVIASLCVASGIFASCVVQNFARSTSAQAKSDEFRISGTGAQLPTWNSTIKGNITLTRGATNRTFTLQQIYTYTQNGTIPVQNYTYTLGGSTINAVGIDPLKLMEIAGWSDCQTFTIKGKDGYSQVFNTSKFVLADPKIYKYSTVNATMLLMAAGNKWLQNFTSNQGDNYGNFVVAGDPSQITNKYKVANVTQILYDTSCVVNVLVNGIQNISIGYNNVTSGNYTTYWWSYTGIGTSWALANYTGITVASLVQLTGITSATNYNISFKAVDGYGSSIIFTKSQMVNGYTPGDNVGNTTNPILLNWQGKQAMLAILRNSTNLGYDSGPFWLIIPGAAKHDYIKEIVAIQIMAWSPAPPGGSTATPGYLIEMILGSIAAVTIVMYITKKKKFTTG